VQSKEVITRTLWNHQAFRNQNNPHKQAVKILCRKALAPGFSVLPLLIYTFWNSQLPLFSSAIYKMNQVYDGSFSDTLHATLFLQDPLRG